jgi:hypothetical protein
VCEGETTIFSNFLLPPPLHNSCLIENANGVRGQPIKRNVELKTEAKALHARSMDGVNSKGREMRK